MRNIRILNLLAAISAVDAMFSTVSVQAHMQKSAPQGGNAEQTVVNASLAPATKKN